VVKKREREKLGSIDTVYYCEWIELALNSEQRARSFLLVDKLKKQKLQMSDDEDAYRYSSGEDYSEEEEVEDVRYILID